ncbi:MAG: hypothetical protein QOE14_2545, partial [Humisphaera sp.]|nr:hypothetical protein [Humisphaera sp.]
SIICITTMLMLSSHAAHAADVSIDRETLAFGERYGITFTTDAPAETNIKYDPLTRGDEPAMRLYLRLFREEFGKYPPAFVRATGLKSVILAKNIKINEQKRGAVPDYPNSAVWHDPYEGDNNEMYQRHVIHHEYFHFADHALQDNVYLSDPYWASLNRPDFRYGGGGHTARTGDQFGVTNREPGFVNRYSVSGLEEDRAEIFASMWIPMEANLLEQRSRSDAILRGKIHRMRGMFKFYSVEPKDPKQQRVRQWIAAVRSRDIAASEKLIAEDAGVMKSTDWLGRTPLHWATMRADDEFLRRVLALPGAAAATNVADEDGWTPLHIAGFIGNVDIVNALLDAGADRNIRDKRKLTPHDWAVAKENVTAARLLEPPAGKR